MNYRFRPRRLTADRCVRTAVATPKQSVVTSQLITPLLNM